MVHEEILERIKSIIIKNFVGSPGLWVGSNRTGAGRLTLYTDGFTLHTSLEFLENNPPLLPKPWKKKGGLFSWFCVKWKLTLGENQNTPPPFFQNHGKRRGGCFHGTGVIGGRVGDVSGSSMLLVNLDRLGAPGNTDCQLDLRGPLLQWTDCQIEHKV